MDSRRSEWQLVGFTILIQMAVGTFVVSGLAAFLFPAISPDLGPLVPRAAMAAVAGCLAIGALSAGLHLGNPASAVFSITNLRKSWLSREALLGGIFGLLCLVLLLRQGSIPPSAFDRGLVLAGMVCGLILIYAIARLYMLRTVPAWNNPGTPAAFFTTTMLMGVMTAAVIFGFVTPPDGIEMAGAVSASPDDLAAGLVILLVVFQLGIFILTTLHLHGRGGIAAQSVRRLGRDLAGVLTWRWSMAFVGIGVLLANLAWMENTVTTFLAYGMIAASEVLGRFLFYGSYQREGF